VDYYWTVAESEHATDVMFRDRVTAKGHQIATAVLAAAQASTPQLTRLAA
jgi:hypothetical protein